MDEYYLDEIGGVLEEIAKIMNPKYMEEKRKKETPVQMTAEDWLAQDMFGRRE